MRLMIFTQLWFNDSSRLRDFILCVSFVVSSLHLQTFLRRERAGLAGRSTGDVAPFQLLHHGTSHSGFGLVFFDRSLQTSASSGKNATPQSQEGPHGLSTLQGAQGQGESPRSRTPWLLRRALGEKRICVSSVRNTRRSCRPWTSLSPFHVLLQRWATLRAWR